MPKKLRNWLILQKVGMIYTDYISAIINVMMELLQKDLVNPLVYCCLILGNRSIS